VKQLLLSFGNGAIELSYEDGRPADLVHFLFRHVSTTPVAEPWTRFLLEDAGGDAGWSLQQDGRTLCQNLPAGQMADRFMGHVCYALAHESRHGLLLHAAAVRAAGRGILLPGKSGAGKSTLSAWFAANGHDYSTDEMVFLANGSDDVLGFSRPITIKAAARHLVPPRVDTWRDQGFSVTDPVEMIAPESLGATVVEGALTLDLIVFPEYRDGTQTALRPLTKAQAAFELMKCLANARNLAEHGLPEAIRLASHVQSYALTYSDMNQAGRSVISLLR
jgi:hypothetical protein